MLPKINTIVYATDLGPGTPYVFRYALSMARQHQAKIIAVHGMEPLTPFGQSLVEHYISHDTTEEKHRQACEKAIARLKQHIQELCRQECEGATDCDNLIETIKVAEGHPGQVILDVAREYEADLIIMGAHGHTMLDDLVGSTTHRVLHGAGQPVLVIKIPRDTHENLG